MGRVLTFLVPVSAIRGFAIVENKDAPSVLHNDLHQSPPIGYVFSPQNSILANQGCELIGPM